MLALHLLGVQRICQNVPSFFRQSRLNTVVSFKLENYGEGAGVVRRVSSRNIKNAFKSRAIKNSGGKFHYGQGIEDACFCYHTLQYKICTHLFCSLQSTTYFLFIKFKQHKDWFASKIDSCI